VIKCEKVLTWKTGLDNKLFVNVVPISNLLCQANY